MEINATGHQTCRTRSTIRVAQRTTSAWSRVLIGLESTAATASSHRGTIPLCAEKCAERRTGAASLRQKSRRCRIASAATAATSASKRPRWAGDVTASRRAQMRTTRTERHTTRHRYQHAHRRDTNSKNQRGRSLRPRPRERNISLLPRYTLRSRQLSTITTRLRSSQQRRTTLQSWIQQPDRRTGPQPSRQPSRATRPRSRLRLP